MKDNDLTETESVCPVCLKRVKAVRQTEGNEVFLVKECPAHGSFRTVIWRGAPAMSDWRRPKEPVHPEVCYGTVEKGCPFDCGLCADHRQTPCSVLLEVTQRCNLSCAVCFADAGATGSADPSLELVSWQLGRAMAAAGPCNLQLSGGEPTLRDDLPQIVAAARQTGYTFIQLNSNGIRLAADPAYVRQLADAGLSAVFLQFDGVDDGIYRSLRGEDLLEQKLLAIRNAGEAGIGVVLVPTIVKGVNSDAIGAIVRQALELTPVVRGIHFQPVSYFGRFPGQGADDRRFTLPELMRSLEDQTKGLLKVADFSPPGGEHAHCSFHGTYLYSANRTLRPLTATGDCCCPQDDSGGGIRKTVDTVSRRWRLPWPATASPVPSDDCSCCCGSPAETSRIEGALDLDTFLDAVKSDTFTISAMAFQDAENLDLERLMGCCIAVISPEGTLVPFCAYNLTARSGRSLYRQRTNG
jgi:uncharacterized radical SAM superfamily Fe-S cluster-containing enzyme